MPNDIRQHKNYKFNFTLADGSTKTITHDVPLPIASEIGCEDVIVGNKQETFTKENVIIPGNTQKRLDFNTIEGYFFDISKIDNYIIKIEGTQITDGDAFVYKPLSNQNMIALVITNNYSDQQQVKVELTAYMYQSKITNVQDNLQYLYDEVNKNTQNIQDNNKATQDELKTIKASITSLESRVEDLEQRIIM